MRCPYCNHKDTAVIDSRNTDDGDVIRRRRVCDECQRRFTTYERIEKLDLKIVKKSGKKEDYDREKIRRGLIKATWKRPVTLLQIDSIIKDVETKIRTRKISEIKSWEIGNYIMDRLIKIDKLSYLLFASVYRDFDTIEDFKKEISKIEQENQ